MRKIQGVVMLAQPPIDKVAAKVLLEIRAGVEHLPVIEFWNRPEYPATQIAGWLDRGVCPIDLGDEKYHRDGRFGSAAEFICHEYDVPASAAIKRLLVLLAENNRRGTLKIHHQAMAGTIRDLYDIPAYSSRDVVKRMGQVIHVWLRAEGGEVQQNRLAEDPAEHPIVGQYAPMFRECNAAPFTPGRYLRDLWRLGADPLEMAAQLRWWAQAWIDVRDALAEGERLLQDFARGNEFVAGGTRGVWIEGGNAFVAKAAVRHFPLVVHRTERGNVAIMAFKHDLSAFADEVIAREPDRWVYRSGAVMNGGRIYTGTAPTSGSREGIVRLLQRYPPLAKTPQRAR